MRGEGGAGVASGLQQCRGKRIFLPPRPPASSFLWPVCLPKWSPPLPLHTPPIWDNSIVEAVAQRKHLDLLPWLSPASWPSCHTTSDPMSTVCVRSWTPKLGPLTFWCPPSPSHPPIDTYPSPIHRLEVQKCMQTPSKQLCMHRYRSTVSDHSGMALLTGLS